MKHGPLEMKGKLFWAKYQCELISSGEVVCLELRKNNSTIILPVRGDARVDHPRTCFTLHGGARLRAPSDAHARQWVESIKKTLLASKTEASTKQVEEEDFLDLDMDALGALVFEKSGEQAEKALRERLRLGRAPPVWLQGLDATLATGDPGISASAHFAAGLMFGYGYGGKTMDYPLAQQHYGAAAALGHGFARFRLGCLVESGYGSPKNEREAAKMYMQSAVMGCAPGALCAGFFYYPEGGLKDYRRASFYFALGAAMGDCGCSSKLKRIRERHPEEMEPLGLWIPR